MSSILGSMKAQKKKRFLASIEWGSADDQSPALKDLPDDLRAVCANRVDDEAAWRVVSRHLTANFVNDRVDALFDLENDVEALEVEVYALSFRDGEVLPRVKANALFELPVKPAIDGVDLEEWQEENDLYFNDVVNFFWKLPSIEGFEGVMTNNDGAGFEATD